ncbi:hypothetical protein ACIF8T_38365 [Streptomyces sp. NPDC085946]|uniref:hypothetical protein n=1 Tax=Streptomyces sp. NPDC085946 TaxID=3365744 RepID=UPI0037CE6BBA
MHHYVHDRAQDPRARAAALLEHIGHGNMPRGAHWNTSEQSAFADAYHEELFTHPQPGPLITHVVFTLAPLDASALSAACTLATSVQFEQAVDIAVDVTQLS